MAEFMFPNVHYRATVYRTGIGTVKSLHTLFFSIFNAGLSFLFCRISVIFRVKSAKAVKITDMDLIKRLGLIVGVFVLFLLIRTLVSPPVVYTGKTDSI